MRRNVQANRDPCCGNPNHPIPENPLLRAISGAEAGFFRFQEADRLSGMGNLVLSRLRDRVLGRKSDPSHLEMTRKVSSRARLQRGKPASGVAGTIPRGMSTRRVPPMLWGSHPTSWRTNYFFSVVTPFPDSIAF